MAKNQTPRTSPTTLNEATLELQITSEIREMFNSVWIDSEYRYFARKLRLPIFNPMNRSNRKSKLYKLTPIEENKSGGWDAQIRVPEGYFRDARILFIQFKRGYDVPGNQEPNSLFSLSKRSPNPYIEFEFNGNRGNNQHKSLRDLKNHLDFKKGKSKDCVMYAFPRITSLEEYAQLEESLLLHTTFLTIDEMDQEAPTGVDLGDLHPHKFRTDKINEGRREICSEVFQLQREDQSIGFIFDLMVLKLSRIWNELVEYQQVYDIDETKAYFQLIVADYLRINPFESDSLVKNTIQKPSYLYEELNDHFRNILRKTKLNHESLNINFNRFQERNLLLFNRISLFIQQRVIYNELINTNEFISNKFLASINNNGISIELEEVSNNFSPVAMVI